MAFSNLATETIITILGDSIPESFENLALTCKHVYVASSRYLIEYNKLRRKYRRLSWNSSTVCVGSVLELFLDIARDPIITRYIEHVDLRTMDDDVDEYSSTRSRTVIAHEQTNTVSDTLSTLIRQSESLGERSVEYWTHQIMSEHEDPQRHYLYSIIFLLSLLSNVKSLALPWQWEVSGPYKEDQLAALVTCIQNANNKSMPHAGLSNLTTLLPMHKLDFNASGQLQQSVPFLATNSLREFYCTGLAANSKIIDKSLELAFPDLSPNLERVELGGCCLDHDELVEYLSCMPALKIFKYSFAVKNQNGVWAWNPAKFVSAIERSHGKQLEELSVSIQGDSCRELKGTGIACMKGFQKLKILELDTRLLIGRRFNDPSQYYPKPERALAACTGIQIPTLLELLPSSVETLHLMIDQANGRACMERLVAGFKDEKQSVLPKLSKISIRCHLHRKQEPLTVDEVRIQAKNNRVWVEPMLQALGSVQVEYSEDYALAYYDTGYSEARFMQGLRKMYDGHN